MRVIPVLDLMRGRAVHARAGRRSEYQPVRSVLAPSTPGDALALAASYRALPGVGELYVADLDAIGGGAWQEPLLRQIAALLPTWVDAGLASASDARVVARVGGVRAIVALETLPSLATLREIVEEIAPTRVALSVDLRAGAPVAAAAELVGASPVAIAERGIAAGATSLVVIDLARVGTGSGVDLALVGALRSALPTVELVAGGGVRGAADLRRLADAGADAALVASVLHDGRLGASELAALAGET
ncbi:MAG TPA: HisA/HisF-related TIM barrel protein [Gemmatimonadaceae bacterium]